MESLSASHPWLPCAPLADRVELALCGPWFRPEFRAVRPWLEPTRRWSADELTPELSELVEQIASRSLAPEIVLYAQTHPRTISVEHLDQLGKVAPLARLVLVVGPWCEGEWRTGAPLPGTARVLWHEVPAWCTAASQAIANGKSPPWSQPASDLPARQWIASLPVQHGGAPLSRGRVTIVAAHQATFDALAGAVRTLGFDAEWQPRRRVGETARRDATNYAAGLWDGGQLDIDEQRDLSRFCRWLAAQGAGVAVLLDFPRAHHWEQTAAAGALVLMGKPYRLAVLAEALDRTMARASSKRPFPICEEDVE